MKTIKQTYAINAPVSKVWQALIDPVIIQKWGGGPAKMGASQGSKFTLWGGEIYGTNKEVVLEIKLKLSYYTKTFLMTNMKNWIKAGKTTTSDQSKNCLKVNWNHLRRFLCLAKK